MVAIQELFIRGLLAARLATILLIVDFLYEFTLATLTVTLSLCATVWNSYDSQSSNWSQQIFSRSQ